MLPKKRTSRVTITCKHSCICDKIIARLDDIEKSVCDKVQINYVQSDSVQCVYNNGYNECVMLLKDNNKIRVNIAGYQMYASVDTGSTISTINKDLFNKVCIFILGWIILHKTVTINYLIPIDNLI